MSNTSWSAPLLGIFHAMTASDPLQRPTAAEAAQYFMARATQLQHQL